MSYDKSISSDDGCLNSPNLTAKQFRYSQIIAQLAKTALFISLRHAPVRVEAPNGFEVMLQKIRAEGGDYDQLKPDQIESYKEKYMYENVNGQRLGNSGLILQHLLFLAHEDDEIKELEKSYMEEIKLIASKETTKYIDGKNNVHLK